jgi:hypothetical protein
MSPARFQFVHSKLTSFPILLGGCGTSRQERKPVLNRSGLVEAEVKVKQKEQLLFHKIHLAIVKEMSVASPVLVLWR